MLSMLMRFFLISFLMSSFLMSVFCFFPSVGFAADGSETCLPPQKSNYFKFFYEKETIPDPAMMDSYRTTLITQRAETHSTIVNCMVFQTDITGKMAQTGVYNSSYRSILDLPLTKFVLGKVEIKASIFKNVYKGICDALKPSRTGAHHEQMETLEGNYFVELLGGVVPFLNFCQNVEGFNLEKLDEVFVELQKSFDKMVHLIPLLILIMMFALQIAWYTIVLFVDKTKLRNINLYALILKFVMFFIAIVFYIQITMFVIALSNFIAYSLVSPEDQEKIMTYVSSFSATSVVQVQTFYNLISSFAKIFIYVSLKILFLSRDILLAITVLLGGICISLGYFSSFNSGEVLRSYLSGWLQTFIKYLLWGPLMAITLVVMALVSIMTQSGQVSGAAVVLSAFSFVYLITNIPKMTHDMSSVILLSALSQKMPQFLKSSIKLGGGAVKSAWGLAWFAIDFFRNRNRNRNSSN